MGSDAKEVSQRLFLVWTSVPDFLPILTSKGFQKNKKFLLQTMSACAPGHTFKQK